MGCSHKNMRALNCHFPKKNKIYQSFFKGNKDFQLTCLKEIVSTGLKETSNEHFESNFINQL